MPTQLQQYEDPEDIDIVVTPDSGQGDPALKQYLIEEFVEDYSHGLLSRRDALKRLAGITGSVLVASNLLSCAPQPTAVPPPAAAVAAIWIAHPLQTESVTYIVQRDESLMGLFYLLTLYCVYLMATFGLNLTVGYAGQMSLGHAGFYAIGAYVAGIVSVRLGLSPWLGVPMAVLFAAAVGAIVAGAALRVTGPYLAMVTIAFGIIVEGILVEWVSVTNGPGGIFNIPKPPLAQAYWIILAGAGLSLLLVANLRRSAWGRAFLAVKGSDVAAESLGLSAYYVRIIAFTVSAGFAGAAGGLFAHLNGYISPDAIL